MQCRFLQKSLDIEASEIWAGQLGGWMGNHRTFGTPGITQKSTEPTAVLQPKSGGRKDEKYS